MLSEIEKIKWLEDVKKNLPIFLDLMKVGDSGYYKFSLNGDLYGLEKNWGLGQAVYASKLYHMLNDKVLISDNKDSISTFILKFAKDNGLIYDNFISRKNFLTRFKKLIFRGDIRNFSNSRLHLAETRQSFAALLSLGVSPIRNINSLHLNSSFFDRYLNSLDWRYPYSAGSHFSHLLFTLEIEKNFFLLSEKKYKTLLGKCLLSLKKLRRSDGFWYKHGVTDDNQIINGAMKVMTGLKITNSLNQIDSPNLMINKCLETGEFVGGCDNLDRLYVLHNCKKLSSHRSTEVEDFALNQINYFIDYYFPESGGFSYFKNKAHTTYYGAKITKGLSSPDIHGTVLFFWAIVLISKIVKLNLGLRDQIT